MFQDHDLGPTNVIAPGLFIIPKPFPCTWVWYSQFKFSTAVFYWTSYTSYWLSFTPRILILEPTRDYRIRIAHNCSCALSHIIYETISVKNSSSIKIMILEDCLISSLLLVFLLFPTFLQLYCIYIRAYRHYIYYTFSLWLSFDLSSTRRYIFSTYCQAIWQWLSTYFSWLEFAI